jgi:hypothetical protein
MNTLSQRMLGAEMLIASTTRPGAALALAVTLLSAPVEAQQAGPAGGAPFSFAVYGDSRPMMYLPFKEDQPELQELFREMFGLVLPAKVAAEVVKKYVKMTYDPVSKELIQIDMPFDTFSEQGQPVLAARERDHVEAPAASG